MTREDMQLISEMLDEKLNKAFDERLNPINERLDKMQADIETIKEDVEIIKEDATEVRTTVEEICKWIDLNFDHKYPFPIDKNIGIV